MSGTEKITVVVDRDLEGIIPGYIENRRKDIELLQELLQQGDFEQIRVLGHRMKGSGAGYGFDQITEIGRSMEEHAKAGDGKIISRLTSELAYYIENIEIEYEDY